MPGAEAMGRASLEDMTVEQLVERFAEIGVIGCGGGNRLMALRQISFYQSLSRWAKVPRGAAKKMLASPRKGTMFTISWSRRPRVVIRPEALIDGPDKLVRVPRLKHWEITGWFMRGNKR